MYLSPLAVGYIEVVIPANKAFYLRISTLGNIQGGFNTPFLGQPEYPLNFVLAPWWVVENTGNSL